MYSNKRKHTFLEKNYRYALIFSLVTWDPNYYNSLQRPSKLMARFFPKVLDFQVLSRLHLSPSPRRLFFSWNGSSSSILIQCDLNKNLSFNVTQSKEVFRNGQNTQFWPLQLTEDLIFNHTPTKSIFVKLRENTFLGMSMVRARSRQGCIRRGDRCDLGRT